jgi:hypothetical protein
LWLCPSQPGPQSSYLHFWDDKCVPPHPGFIGLDEVSLTFLPRLASNVHPPFSLLELQV